MASYSRPFERTAAVRDRLLHSRRYTRGLAQVRYTEGILMRFFSDLALQCAVVNLLKGEILHTFQLPTRLLSVAVAFR